MRWFARKKGECTQARQLCSRARPDHEHYAAATLCYHIQPIFGEGGKTDRQLSLGTHSLVTTRRLVERIVDYRARRNFAQAALVFAAVALPVASLNAWAEVYRLSPADDVQKVAKSLEPGDELVLATGVYDTNGRWKFELRGTPTRPIVIRAGAGQQPLVRASPDHNVMEIRGEHYVIEGLELTGGSHGLRLGESRHARLENLRIHDVGDVGISCNRSEQPCAYLVLRGNEIWNTGLSGGPGEGIYLGCHRGGCALTHSLIERNYVHDTRAGDQGDGIEIKQGSFANIVRDNVTINTRYPGLVLYSYPEGADKPPNVVERNLIWGTLDNGIQIAGQVVLRNNLVLDAKAGGIVSKPDASARPRAIPSRARIVHNTVFNAGEDCLRTIKWKKGRGNVIANNALYCNGATAFKVSGGLGGASVAGNVVLGALRGIDEGVVTGYGEQADLGQPSGNMFVLESGSALRDAGVPGFTVDDDFDGFARNDGRPDAGAFEAGDLDMLRWPLLHGFKTTPEP